MKSTTWNGSAASRRPFERSRTSSAMGSLGCRQGGSAGAGRRGWAPGHSKPLAGPPQRFSPQVWRSSWAYWRSGAHTWMGCGRVLVCSLPDLEASALFPEGVTATTDPKELELIKDDRCVYFCTYMSLPVLQAGTGRRGMGLGIFDEAHRTAGCTDRLYSQGLVDDEFPMKHRLFLTATAKHVDGDGSPVFSMEDEGTYGPVASTLSCREAMIRNHLRLLDHRPGHRPWERVGPAEPDR